ncbi:RNA-directed DNA polymerase, eukaryota, reverse transcriptase zinc-binding domain protein [Tanacetum coccineum]
MVSWVMTCVSSATFSIRINSDIYGYFKSGRGLRQEDQISPYLFTLIIEVFSLMIARKVEDIKSFKYHKGCKGMKLTHLSFADDLLVLFQGDVESIKVIKHALMKFSNSSGLKPNMHKSVVFFGSVKEVIKIKILEAMPFKIRPHIVHIVGNGRNISMWDDSYDEVGHLSNFVTNKEIYDARMDENCSVADMIMDNEWVWPNNWVRNFTQLKNLKVPLLNSNHEDSVKWKKNNEVMVDFSIKEAWLDMKCVQSTVSWWKIIWFPQCNPRCAFILWMEIKEKLATQDKMMEWNKDQLLLSLYKMYMGRISDDWGDIVNRMSCLPYTNAIRSVLRRLILATIVYYIWKERNSRLFSNNRMKEDVLLQNIKENIKLQLQG